MELLLEQISQITHGVVLNRIKPKVQSEGVEYPILSISQLLDEENGIRDYEVPSVFVDKKKSSASPLFTGQPFWKNSMREKSFPLILCPLSSIMASWILIILPGISMNIRRLNYREVLPFREIPP